MDIRIFRRSNWTLAAGFLAALVCTLQARATAAQFCGTASTSEGLDSGDNVVIVGEIYEWNSALSDWIVTYPRAAGVCVRDQYGTWHLNKITTCNTSTTSADRLRIIAGDGDDSVAAHPSSGSLFSCGTGSHNLAIGPWYTAGWDFGLYVDGGGGADEIYGSPNSDRLYSTTALYASDGEIDTVCGYDGHDYLYGDTTDTSSDFECLDGGGDDTTDYCHGIGTGAEYDEWQNCYQHYSADAAGIMWCPPYVCPTECYLACPSTAPDLTP